MPYKRAIALVAYDRAAGEAHMDIMHKLIFVAPHGLPNLGCLLFWTNSGTVLCYAVMLYFRDI